MTLDKSTSCLYYSLLLGPSSNGTLSACGMPDSAVCAFMQVCICINAIYMCLLCVGVQVGVWCVHA